MFVERKVSVAVGRIVGILIGCIIGMIAVAIFSPGSAVGNIHGGVASGVRQLAALVLEVFDMRINCQQQITLKSRRRLERKGRQVETTFREKCSKIIDSRTKLNAMLPFIDWEPKWLHPFEMQWVGSHAKLEYRILIARLIRLTSSLTTLGGQLSVASTLAPPDPELEITLRAVSQSVSDLLLECADCLDEGKSAGREGVSLGDSMLEQRKAAVHKSAAALGLTTRVGIPRWDAGGQSVLALEWFGHKLSYGQCQLGTPTSRSHVKEEVNS